MTPALLLMSDDNQSLFDLRSAGEVYVLWGKALGKLIGADRTGGSIDVRALERAPAIALPAGWA